MVPMECENLTGAYCSREWGNGMIVKYGFYFMDWVIPYVSHQ